MSEEAFNLVLGARLSLRESARHALEAIDQLAEHEIAQIGWSRDDLAALERLAAMRIPGIAFGNWPR